MSHDRAERFEDHALGRPYHVALVDLKSRSQPHSHRDYYEVMAVVAGEGEHLVSRAGGATHHQPLQPGDVVLIGPRDHHTIVGALLFYNVAFPATGWRTFIGLAAVGTGWDNAEQPPHASFPDGRATRACAVILERFHDAPGQVDLIRFWADVVELLAPSPTGSDRPPGMPEWLFTATAAMNHEQHLREGVPRLRALAHVSDAHLARSMRHHYGTTPSDFVADLRLRHAAMLLATTTRTVAEIAYTCGFASASYFTRCFREAHGASPRQFRNAARHAFVPS